MYEMFLDRAKEVTINGTIEKWVINRLSNTNSRFSANYVSKGLPPNNTIANNGDILISGTDTYFIVSLRKSVSGTNQCQLYQANTTVDIVRVVKQFIGGQFTGKYTEQSLFTNQPSMYQDVNGKMQQYDVGLLSTTTRKFLIPKCNIQLLDRIKFNGENMQIDIINTTEYENLLSIQCSPDKRVTV